MLTAAGYAAIKQVYDQRIDREYQMWAIERVDFRNAHQMFGDAALPWELGDILAAGNRRQRAAKAQAEKIESEMRLMKLQRGLGAITKDSSGEELPAWAKRQWDPKDHPELFGGKP